MNKDQKALENAIASVMIEGSEFTNEEIKLLKRKLNNEIDEEEFLKLARAIAEKNE